MSDNPVMCLVNVCDPGGYTDHSPPSPDLKELEVILESHGIAFTYVDTVSGWFNLDQNWLEFRAEVHTGWGPCQIACFNELQSMWFNDVLGMGKLVMMIHYINEDGSYTRHL